MTVFTGGDFGTIDLDTGAFTRLGNSGLTLAGLGVANGTLYGATYEGVNPGSLYTVNPANGGLTLIGSSGISYDELGSTTLGLYAIGSDAKLYSIDPSSGAATLRGPIGMGFGTWRNLSTNASTLYFANGASLYTLDTNTGAATLLGNMGGPQMGAMVLERGILYGGQETPGQRIDILDLMSGAATVGPALTGASGVFGGLAPYPLPPSCVPPPSGLVAWYPGEGNGNDIVGGNNGALQNGATFASGHVGQAFGFNGISANVSIPDAPSLDFSSTSPMTVELWAFRTSANSVQHLLGKRNGCGGTSTEGNYQMAIDSNPGLLFGNPGGAAVHTDVDLPLNTWTHLAATFDGTTYRFYIDGVLHGSATGSLGPPNSAPLTIGNSGTCNSFGGLIDEPSIYNRALTQAEIQAIFTAGSTGKCLPLEQPLSVIAIKPSGSDIVVTFHATAGKSYRLERKLSIDNPTWQAISGVPDLTAANSGPAQLTDLGGANQAKAFYRVRLLP